LHSGTASRIEEVRDGQRSHYERTYQRCWHAEQHRTLPPSSGAGGQRSPRKSYKRCHSSNDADPRVPAAGVNRQTDRDDKNKTTTQREKIILHLSFSFSHTSGPNGRELSSSMSTNKTS
jgi:hypothetical protein